MTDLADELERLAKEATPGDWVVEDNRSLNDAFWIAAKHPEVGRVSLAEIRNGCEEASELGNDQANATLIVALRNALPEILSALRGEAVLWCCHARGPDDLFAAPDFETAVAWSDTLNAVGDLVKAVPARWTGSPEQHAADLPRSIAGFKPRRAPSPESNHP